MAATWRYRAEQTLTYGWVAFLLSFLVFEQAFVVNYFLWAGVLLPSLFVVRYTDLKKYHGSALTNLWCALIVFLLVSFFWNSESAYGEFGRYLKRALYLYGFGLATFLVFARNPNFDDKLFTWAPLIIAAAALLQITLHSYQQGFPGERMLGPGRLSNPIHFGVVAAAVSIAALLQLSRHGWRMQLLTVLAILINCSAIYLCQSRGALLAIMATLVVSGLFIRRIFPALLVVLIVLATLALVFDPAILLERGMSFRTTIWYAQLERFSNCPALIGCGLGIDSGITVEGLRFENTHSLYLGWLLFSGVIGLAGYLLFLVGLLYKSITTQLYAWATLLLMGATSTLTSGDHILITPNPYWPVMLIPVAALLAQVALAKPLPTTEQTTETPAAPA